MQKSTIFAAQEKPKIFPSTWKNFLFFLLTKQSLQKHGFCSPIELKKISHIFFARGN
jgi:hypothetical protein